MVEVNWFFGDEKKREKDKTIPQLSLDWAKNKNKKLKSFPCQWKFTQVKVTLGFLVHSVHTDSSPEVNILTSWNNVQGQDLNMAQQTQDHIQFFINTNRSRTQNTETENLLGTSRAEGWQQEMHEQPPGPRRNRKDHGWIPRAPGEANRHRWVWSGLRASRH